MGHGYFRLRLVDFQENGLDGLGTDFFMDLSKNRN